MYSSERDIFGWNDKLDDKNFHFEKRLYSEIGVTSIL